MRFRTSTAGTAWRELPLLARLCEAAGLSADQAEAARLATEANSFGAIMAGLSALCGRRVTYPEARRLVYQAEARLKRARPDLVALHRRQMLELIEAMRNVRRTSPRIAIYPERQGIYDRVPIRLRSRLTGESPEDLMRQPLRFLHDLPRLLAETGGQKRAIRE